MSEKLQDIINKQHDQINPDEENMDEVVQLVGFVIGEEEFSVPILSIQEIIKPIEWTRVPQTPEYVLGVFNLRGSVIPLIDLRLKFGLPSEKMTDNSRFMVMKNDSETAGFVIDRLTEAIRLKKHEIGPAPETAMQEKTMIEGVGKQNDKILTILKVDKLLERDF
ncbi:chemotaxis protein CheW [Sulfurimonas sp. MAG313]|nr:chemotaxis protein CheW [Sulfurimonas sp. MAG313]MDF1879810.1 chemotaxis protein CheW [Sulfurimonas sp. MAG313]